MTGQPPTDLSIVLLGAFRVVVDGEPVAETAWRLRKARTLVKLLALAPEHRCHRELVLETLWPDRDPETASNNLRQVLFVARRALGPHPRGAAAIVSRHDQLGLEAKQLHTDVAAFETGAALAEREPSVEHHQAALALYGGALLPEDRFESWASAPRAALSERYVALLVGLAGLQVRGGDLGAAATTLQQVLATDGCHEYAHRELMRLFAASGRRQRALAQFHLLRETLRREYEDEPEPQTRQLYQDILTRRHASGGDGEPATPARRVSTGERAPGNLPLSLTSFVGRAHALSEVSGLCARHRIVTLTGPGGCGKTRLALEVGAALRREAPDGVWLVELAGLTDAAWVPNEVASVLGVQSRSTRSSSEAISAHIAERDLVLVLDNCEHVIEGCAAMAEGLLRRCPRLRVLATSREPLHIPGEVNWRVPSLSASEAALLFSERAAAVPSAFSANSATDLAVAEICRRVDGMPLAIELAAARTGVLAPGQIAERLRDSLAVLASGHRSPLTRQQTLTATLDWSHALLDDEERVLFRRLGTFAGECGLDAIERVCDGDLDVLGRLVDKSLVVVAEDQGRPRYRLLDTIRTYARARLADCDETAELEARHRRYYADFAETRAPAATAGPGQPQRGYEIDQLRMALRTALECEPHLALRIAAGLWPYWHDRGLHTEGVRWLELALAAAPEPCADRALALRGLSVLALRISDYPRVMAAGREAVAVRRVAGDERELAEDLHHYGTLAWVFSDRHEAQRRCEESLALVPQRDPAAAATVLHTLGVIAASHGDLATGRDRVQRAVTSLRGMGDGDERVLLGVALGYGPFPIGPPHRRFLEQTFVAARRTDPTVALALATCTLAVITRELGDHEAARELLEQSLELFHARGDRVGQAQATALLGNLAALTGDAELADDLLGAALRMREAIRDARSIGLSLIALAVARCTAGDTAAAEAYAARARDLFERCDDGPGRASTAVVRGYILAEGRRYAEARDLQTEALTYWRAFIPDTLWCATVLLELADLDVALGEEQRAVGRLTEAAEVCVHNGDEPLLTRCRTALGALGNGALTTG